jgi:glycine cleavage system H protein
MNIPDDRKYLETHEWHKFEGGLVVVGITQVAADELTAITFVKLPKVGTRVKAGQPIGEIESTKTTADLMTAVNGEVVEVNTLLESKPELVNTEPHSGAWMVKIKPDSPSEPGNLLSAAEYRAKVGH